MHLPSMQLLLKFCFTCCLSIVPRIQQNILKSIVVVWRSKIVTRAHVVGWWRWWTVTAMEFFDLFHTISHFLHINVTMLSILEPQCTTHYTCVYMLLLYNCSCFKKQTWWVCINMFSGIYIHTIGRYTYNYGGNNNTNICMPDICNQLMKMQYRILKQ